MADVTYFPGNDLYLSPNQTFDITSIVAKRVLNFVLHYSFCTDGTMFVIRSTAVPDTNGAPVMRIVGWDHYSGADLLQSAVTDLPLQPFLDMLASRNPSSVRAFTWLTGTDDVLTGSEGRDVMRGLGGNDTLNGGLDNDKLFGGKGDDLIQGDLGRDSLQGEAGNDTLDGGKGIDVLKGGDGADVFLFHGISDGGDKISDFVSGIDHIALEAANFGFARLVAGGNFLVGESAVAVSAAPTLIYHSASGILSYDADGTGGMAETTLAKLVNAPALTVDDFLLF
ncbi:hemolysin type calcium-binding protein [Rhodobacter viridis]|uniref:Hemolysin type calcium-binding protein n=1 Tax=Rhodobacter viridis TaxID=1054202 RepID=A0A318U5N5_9RHOB|nr:hypothetical protein [Rhodobacter viridis]PYF12703.1 hemolysin type calcium-binding protein [Rhodobacter viridis]